MNYDHARGCLVANIENRDTGRPRDSGFDPKPIGERSWWNKLSGPGTVTIGTENHLGHRVSR